MSLVNTVGKAMAAGLLAILAMILFAANASAQEPITTTLQSGEQIGGVDLVFLIDNSLSMYVNPGNDVQKNRIESVRFVMTLLGFDNLYLHPARVNRIAVITWGGPGTASIDIPLTSLKTSSQKEWEDLYNYLKGQISEQHKSATQPMEAFQRAIEAFTQAEPAPEPRAKGIILITDGMPDFGENRRCPQEPFCRNYFNNLATLINNNFKLTKEPRSTDGYHIWIVAMGGDWARVRQYWEAIIGDHWRFIDTAADIPGVFTDIAESIYSLCALPEGQSCWIENTFEMPPYLDRAVFSIISSAPLSGKDPIIFYTETNQRLDESDYTVSDWQSFGQSIWRFSVFEPKPGLWRFQPRADLQVQVRFDPLFGYMRFIEPAGVQSQLSSVRVKFQVYNRRGGVMEEQKGYPLVLRSELSAPDAGPVPLGFAYEGNGIYAAQQAVPLMKVGNYSLKVTGNYLHQGKEIPIFPTTTYTFTVAPVTAKLVAPQPGKAQQPLGPVEIRYQVLDAAGNFLDVAPNLDINFQVEIKDPSGVVETVDLAPIGTGQFSAPFFAAHLDRSYQLNAHGWLETGVDRLDLFQVMGDRLDVGTLTVNMVKPAPGDVSKENTRIPIAFEILDGYGEKLGAASNFPLDLSGSYAVKPSGATIPLGAQCGPAVRGDCTAELLADEPGEWKVHFEARATDPGGHASDSISGDWSVPVLDTVPLKLIILEPKTGDSLPLRRVPRVPPFVPGTPTRVSFRLQFLNGDNNIPVAFQEITDLSPLQVLGITLQNPANINLGDQAQVAVSNTDPTVLVVSSDAMVDAGDYLFGVEVVATQDPKGGYVWPVSGTRQEVRINRYDNLALLGKILLGVEIFVFVALLVATAYIFWLHTLPLKGVLYLRPVGLNTREDVPIASRIRRTTKRVVKMDQFDIHKVRVRSVSRDPLVIHVKVYGRGKKACWEDDLEVNRGLMRAGKNNAVEITYREDSAKGK